MRFALLRSLTGTYIHPGALSPAQAMLFAINNWDSFPSEQGDLVSTNNSDQLNLPLSSQLNLTLLLDADKPCALTIQSIDQFFNLVSDEPPSEAYQFYQDENNDSSCKLLTVN